MENVKEIALLFFGKAREITQVKNLVLSLPTATTVGNLRSILSEKFPGLDTSLAFAIAINQRYAQNDDVIPDHAEVAIIPPVSGG